MSNLIKIYLIYSRIDTEVTRKIHSGLQKTGFLPWMSGDDVLPGEDWKSAISKAMSNSDIFVSVLSQSWVLDSNPTIELDNALSRSKETKLIIPVLLERGVTVPAKLKNLRSIDFSSDFDRGLYQLVSGLRKIGRRLDIYPGDDSYRSLSAAGTLRNLSISRIKLVNIRCFNNLDINLEHYSKPIEWIMFLGDNAVGKTTILRSIALGLCNESDATALMKSVSGGFVRQGCDEGYIKIELSDVNIAGKPTSNSINKKNLFLRALLNAFPTKTKLMLLCDDLEPTAKEIINVDSSLEMIVFNLINWAEATGRINELIEAARSQSPNNHSLREFDKQERTKVYTITTQVIKQMEDTEVIRKMIEPDTDFLWSDIFVCGYGSNRTTQTYANYESYRSIDAVHSLFSSQPQFQNPELVLLRRDPETRRQIEHLLLDILMLDGSEHKIHYTDRGIEVEGPWGRQPLQVMSDGYRSTTQWVLDFMGWLIQANRLLNNPDIGGILLIDEIEQHLHPRWQRHIVQRLRQKFPKTQIIASTHTPLVAAGIADIDSGVLLKLGQDQEGHTDVRIIDKRLLDGKRADQILTSEAFGLFTSRNPGSQDDVDRYSELLSNSARTEAEEAEFQSLRSHIQDAFSDGESEAAQIVRKAVGVALQETVQDISPELIDLELRKQLHQLSQPET